MKRFMQAAIHRMWRLLPREARRRLFIRTTSMMVPGRGEATAYLIRRTFSDRGERVDWDLCFAKDGQEALDCLFRRGRYVDAAVPDFNYWTGIFLR